MRRQHRIMATVSRLGVSGVLSVVAGVLGALVFVAYVAIVPTQDDAISWGQFVPWALSMAAPCVLVFASFRLRRRSARWSRVAAALLFAGLAFATGYWLVLLPAAVLAGLAAYQTKESVPSPS
jgi:Na+/melibiose symporter-like transporter